MKWIDDMNRDFILHSPPAPTSDFKMRSLLKFLIASCLILFFAGAIAAWEQWLKPDLYIVLTGIVGSFAPVLGLVAIGSSSFSTRDVRKVEADLFKELGEKLNEVNEYEQKVSEGRAEIDRIKQERAELELLVRKTSLQVFF